MISRQIPAEVLTVKDQVVGKLGWDQLGLLAIPAAGIILSLFCIAPFGRLSVVKGVIWVGLALPSALLAIRWQGRLVIDWLKIWLSYWRRRKQPTLPSQQIVGDLVYVGRGDWRLVLLTEGLNLDLLTPAEQEQVFGLYENLLNSLTLPWQILVRLRRLDPQDYLTNWQQTYATESLASQQKDYLTFVTNLIDQHQVVDRQFYIVLTCQLTQHNPKEAYQQLHSQAQIVKQGLARLGLPARSLKPAELVSLLGKVQ